MLSFNSIIGFQWEVIALIYLVTKAFYLGNTHLGTQGILVVWRSKAAWLQRVMEFRIFRGEKMANSKFTMLFFERADLGLFKDLLGSVLWNKALGGEKGAQESWLICRHHLPGITIPTKKKSRHETYIDKEATGKAQVFGLFQN